MSLYFPNQHSASSYISTSRQTAAPAIPKPTAKPAPYLKQPAISDLYLPKTPRDYWKTNNITKGMFGIMMLGSVMTPIIVIREGLSAWKSKSAKGSRWGRVLKRAVLPLPMSLGMLFYGSFLYSIITNTTPFAKQIQRYYQKQGLTGPTSMGYATFNDLLENPSLKQHKALSAMLRFENKLYQHLPAFLIRPSAGQNNIKS